MTGAARRPPPSAFIVGAWPRWWWVPASRELLHVDALRRLGVEVAAALDSSGDYEAALADPAVDFIQVATPNHLHFAQANAALAAGKNVLCEKPPALTSAESAELVRLAQEAGVVAATYFNLRFYPQCQEARARAAGLGELWHVHGSYLQDWLALPSDTNWPSSAACCGRWRTSARTGST